MAARTLSERENILRMYRHEKPEYLPNHATATFSFEEYSAFHERPGPGSDTDSFGVKYYLHESYGGVPAHDVPHVVSDVTKWREQVKFPDLDAIDWPSAAKTDGADRADRANKLIKAQVQAGLWERAHSLMGMEYAYIAAATEPDAVEELIAAIADYKIKLYSYLIKHYKPDVIRQHDDYGTNTAMQISPAMWRRFIGPHIHRFAELCHLNGVIFELHSCGLVEDVVPDFAEAGVDAWNGMHINDVLKLQRLTGSRLVYNMTLNTPKYLMMDSVGKLSEEWLRHDVRKTVAECGREGTYFPVFNAPGDRNWWGLEVIRDEIEKVRCELVF